MKKIFLLAFLLIGAFPALAQLPAPLAGNWIDGTSNEWTYGFFDEYALYDTDFWDYESIDTKKNKTTLVLRNGDRTLRLELSPDKNGGLTVREGREKARSFVKMGKVYPRYTTADTEPFPEAAFTPDSATLIGVYHGFDRIPEQFKQQFGANFLTVGVPDFLSAEDIDYRTTIDSLGRFEITIPLLNAQEVFLDWKRLQKMIILQPGERQLLFVDFADILPRDSDGSMDGYRARDKEILFMGTNARLNNELGQYEPLSLYINYQGEKERSLRGMDFLRYCEELYNENRAHYEKYVAEYPAVSEKFRYYTTQVDRFTFASDLIKYKFTLWLSREKEFFPEEYMDYIEARFPLSDPREYTLTTRFRYFFGNYIGYKVNPGGSRSVFVTLKDAVRELENEGKLTRELRQQVDRFDHLNEQIRQEADSAKRVALATAPEIQELIAGLNSNALLLETMHQLTEESMFEQDLVPADSLLAGLPELRELWDAAAYWYRFDHERVPLPGREMAAFDRRIQNPYYRARLLETNDYYAALQNQAIEDEASLKDTRDLESIRDPQELFAKLIEPYRGKVIYLDFWGTWCGPCRENMQLMPAVKEELADKEVIFMYLANNSPEASWKSIIKEMGLTGPNVVHYRLPDAQEAMIERHFSVNAFPTYLLIDRQGKIVDRNAPSPREKGRLLEALNAALTDSAL